MKLALKGLKSIKISIKIDYNFRFSGLPNFPRAMAITIRAVEEKTPWFSGYLRRHHGWGLGKNF